MKKETPKVVLTEAEAQSCKFRVLMDGLELGQWREGDIVTGAMLKGTTYYLKNQLIEQVDDDTAINTDETRRESAKAGAATVDEANEKMKALEKDIADLEKAATDAKADGENVLAYLRDENEKLAKANEKLKEQLEKAKAKDG